MIIDIKDEKDLESMLYASDNQPIVLLKHSTICPISSNALIQFEQFAHGNQMPCYRVLVIENRLLSRQIADLTGVTHQSPQVILLFQRHAKWNASHYDITKNKLSESVM